MNNVDEQYINLLKDVLKNGEEKITRSGLVKSVFGRTMEFDLSKGLPLLTTKKVFYNGIIKELLWFISGSTNIKSLVDNGVNIWNEDAYRYYKELIGKSKFKAIPFKDFLKEVKQNTKALYLDSSNNGYKNMMYSYGDLGVMYGKNWRHFGDKCVDQIKYVINEIENNPTSRRILLTCYDPNTVNEAALYPCHILYQFNVTNSGTLDCMVNVRSNDLPCGCPFNIASAALLTHMIAEVTELKVGKLFYVIGNAHIYGNQIKSVKEQIQRKGFDELPKFSFKRKIKDIDDFKFEDFLIEDYKHDDAIHYELSVG